MNAYSFSLSSMVMMAMMAMPRRAWTDPEETR